jgi:hypothetical protein
MIILAAKKIFLAALWSKNALFVEVRKRLRKALVMVKNDGIVRTARPILLMSVTRHRGCKTR